MAKLKASKEFPEKKQLSYDPVTDEWGGIPAGVEAEYYRDIKGTDTKEFLTNVPRIALLTDGLYTDGPVARVYMKVKSIPDSIGILRHQVNLKDILDRNGALNESTAAQLENGDYVEIPVFAAARRVAESVDRLIDKYNRINEEIKDIENPPVHYNEKTGQWSGIPAGLRLVESEAPGRYWEVQFYQINENDTPSRDPRIYLVHDSSSGNDSVRVDAIDEFAETPFKLAEEVSKEGGKDPLLSSNAQYFFEYRHYGDAVRMSETVARAEENLQRSRGNDAWKEYLDMRSHEFSISLYDSDPGEIYKAYGNDAKLIAALAEIPLEKDGTAVIPHNRADVVQKALIEAGYAVEYIDGTGSIESTVHSQDVVAPKPDMDIDVREMREAITDFSIKNGSFLRDIGPKSSTDDYDIQLKSGNRLGMTVKRTDGGAIASYYLYRHGRLTASFHSNDSHLTPGEVKKIYASLAAGAKDIKEPLTQTEKMTVIDSYIESHRTISEHERLTGEKPDMTRISADIPGTDLTLYRRGVTGGEYILSDTDNMYADFHPAADPKRYGIAARPDNISRGADIVYAKVMEVINAENRHAALDEVHFQAPELNRNRFSPSLVVGRWHDSNINAKRLYARYGENITMWQQRMLSQKTGKLSPEYYNIAKEDRAIDSLMKTIHAAYYNLKTPIYISEKQLAEGSFRVKSTAVPVPVQNRQGIIENYYNIEDTDIPQSYTEDKYKEIVSGARDRIAKLQGEARSEVITMLREGKGPQGLGIEEYVKPGAVSLEEFGKTLDAITESKLPGDKNWPNVNSDLRDTVRKMATWMNEIRYGFPDKPSFGLTTVSELLSTDAMEALRHNPQYTEYALQTAGTGIADSIVTDAKVNSLEEGDKESQKERESISLPGHDVSKENEQEHSRGLHM